MDRSMIDDLICPMCKSKLFLSKQKNMLVCKVDKLAYPIRENIPIMLMEEASILNLAEINKNV